MPKKQHPHSSYNFQKFCINYFTASEETKPQESLPQAPAPEPAPYLDSQGGGGFLWGWVF